MDTVLKFDNVSLAFGDTVALQNISFEMAAGATRVIYGAAGAGKSTLLKTAVGLLKPDSGRVELLGRDITDVPEQQMFTIRSRVGVLFQEGGLFDSFTVEDNVAYPLENQKCLKVPESEIRGRVTEALRFVELEHAMTKFPSEISGGMRRRVGIARAVVTEPPLVLYDSPTAGLDPITANTIMALIAKERDMANTANLIVSHRYQDGQIMAGYRWDGSAEKLVAQSGNHGSGDPSVTTFMVMNDGKLVFEGTQAELEASKDSYVSKFVPRRQ